MNAIYTNSRTYFAYWTDEYEFSRITFYSDANDIN